MDKQVEKAVLAVAGVLSEGCAATRQEDVVKGSQELSFLTAS